MRPHERRVRIPALVVAACSLLAACGGTSVDANGVASTTIPNASTPLAVADNYIAVTQRERLVGRGCVRRDQIPDTTLTGASTVCVYDKAFRGEVRVGVVQDAGTWRVVGEETK